MMGYLDDLHITNPELYRKMREGLPYDMALENIALLLDGEARGKHTVICPYGDKQLTVIFSDPNRPSKFYILYAPDDYAKAYVQGKLAALPDGPRKDYSKQIAQIWGESLPAEGTLVERYLRECRKITIPIPPTLRFHPELYHSEDKRRWPGMVAAVCDTEGQIKTLHRTFLRRDGRDKAPVDPDRKDLGREDGWGIYLSPISDFMLAGEGIETVLSAMQLFGKPGIACGVAWNLRTLLLPDAVRGVGVLVDQEESGEVSARRAPSTIGGGARAAQSSAIGHPRASKILM
jgi:hypothetical protein